jgi:hypothetical protein
MARLLLPHTGINEEKYPEHRVRRPTPLHGRRPVMEMVIGGLLIGMAGMVGFLILAVWRERGMDR